MRRRTRGLSLSGCRNRESGVSRRRCRVSTPGLSDSREFIRTLSAAWMRIYRSPKSFLRFCWRSLIRTRGWASPASALADISIGVPNDAETNSHRGLRAALGLRMGHGAASRAAGLERIDPISKAGTDGAPQEARHGMNAGFQVVDSEMTTGRTGR